MVFIYNVYYRIDYFDDEIYNSPELDQNKPIYTTAASCLKVPIIIFVQFMHLPGISYINIYG